MSQIYVPDEAYLVCTDGMMMQQIKVDSQHSVKIAGGKLAATIDDRTGGNFICAKMVIAGAIAGAILAAIVVATAPVSIGLGAAMAVGAAAGAVGGGLLASIPCTCALLTMPKDWTPVHPHVKFEKKEALIQKSILPCILGGNVLIHYSKEAAQAAIDLKRKKTAFNVAFIIGAAYLAGPAVEGLSSAISGGYGIFKEFGKIAGMRYLGSLGVGFATNYGIDYAKDEVKGKVYEGLGVKEYVDGYESDIQKIQDKLEPEVIEPSEVYDNTKRGGESLGAGEKNVGNRVGDYEINERESRTVLNDRTGGIEEYNSTRTSTATPGAIPGRNTTVNTSSNREFYSDNSGTYMHNESSRQELGREYRPLNASDHKKVLSGTIKDWASDYRSRPSVTKDGVKGGGWAVDLVVDAYKGITNYILKGDIEDYIDAIKTAEFEAKKKINVIEKQI